MINEDKIQTNITKTNKKDIKFENINKTIDTDDNIKPNK